MTKNSTKKIPRLRFKGFEGEWEEKTFGDIFNLITDYVANGSFKSIRDNVKKYDTCNYAYMIRIADFNNNFKGPFIYTDVDGYNYLSKSKLNPNDLIMSNVGYVGKTFKVPQLDKPMTLAPNSILLRSSNYDIDFMYHLMNVDIIQYKIKINSSTGAQEKINKTDFKNISLFIPSYKEQKNISRLLLKLDNIINLQFKKVEQLKKLKRGYLQKMFPQKGESVPILRFDGFSSEWKEKTFGDIFNLITDYVANGSFKSIRDNVKKYDTCNYAYMIRIADFNNNFKGPFIYTDVDGYNYLSKSKLNPNDLIMSNVGYVGKTFKVPQLDKPMTLAPNSILLRSSNYDIDFMYHLMNVDIIQYKIKINSSTGAQEKINKTDFKNISLFIPSYKEQKNISRLLLKLDNIINHQDNKLLSLKALKNAYLQKLFC